MRIIPAIDILGGKCVRLTRGDFSTAIVYKDDPADMAKEIEDNGIRFIHLVDLDGAGEKKVVNWKALERIASKTGLSIDFSGGIRTEEDIRIAFRSGACQVSAGSIAVSSPSAFLGWIQKYGNEKIILAADCRNRMIATGAWEDNSGREVVEFLTDYQSKGVLYTICTDIDRDGMMKGPPTELYREILSRTSIKLIASGGIASVKDIGDVVEAGCEAVIIGKAIYEGRIKLKELRDLC